jgi:hypothetical protein
MKLHVVKEDDRVVWVAALAQETMYGYVPDTGKFHDNNALRNDYYMERHFTYEEIGSAEARRLIDGGIEPFDEDEDEEVLASGAPTLRPSTPPKSFPCQPVSTHEGRQRLSRSPTPETRAETRRSGRKQRPSGARWGRPNHGSVRACGGSQLHLINSDRRVLSAFDDDRL